jgi:hypothetical protein
MSNTLGKLLINTGLYDWYKPYWEKYHLWMAYRHKAKLMDKHFMNWIQETEQGKTAMNTFVNWVNDKNKGEQK